MSTSDAEREVALKASAMDSLAESIETRTFHVKGNDSAAVRLTGLEWQLVIFALRAAAE